MRPRWKIRSALLLAAALLTFSAEADDLKVLKMGVGDGLIVSDDSLINCGGDCEESYQGVVTLTLKALDPSGSTAVLVDWLGDCAGRSTTCTLTVDRDRSVRATFDPVPAIPTLNAFTPAGITNFLNANPHVNSAPAFLHALPREFKQNWILMSRSESLQTGTAQFPRILLPSPDAEEVFTLGVAAHSSYPGAHPNAIEYMQWDANQKNFRFHEIVLDAIPAMGSVPARNRGVSMDDVKCAACHSTRNVLNNTIDPGTTGVPPGLIAVKNKPNWDAYDSWGGMMPLNRDRIYQGSLEAAAFRKILNPWTWATNPFLRSIFSQLELQPPGVDQDDAITRIQGGENDGHVVFSFDPAQPVMMEPLPQGTEPVEFTSYAFDGQPGVGIQTDVERGGKSVTLRHTTLLQGIDEGRGVRFFDLLGGFGNASANTVQSNLNAQRIADELVEHRWATGGVPIDPRPIALAVLKQCVVADLPNDTVVSNQQQGPLPILNIDLGFFNTRNGMGIRDLVDDTETRAISMPRRKADLQKLNLDRTGDLYLLAPEDGLIQEYGAGTSVGQATDLKRVRQEVFRRPIDLGDPDRTVMGGIYVDREKYTFNTQRMALLRYFLEPLGVAVDKWSLGVRGRSRTYAMADVFARYVDEMRPALEASLTSRPVGILASPYSCASLIKHANQTLDNSPLTTLPRPDAVPTYSDVQRIFNKSCIECHGGLRYPPYENYGNGLDLSEDEAPPAGQSRLTRSHSAASIRARNLNGPLYQRIIDLSEDCPFGMMPCGGPSLSKTDIETIRRWIVGGRPSSAGDPHIRTMDGVHYDFQAAGEFVLLRDQGFEIQTRQAPVETAQPLGPNPHTGLTSCVSVNTAVALRVGPHRITYQPGVDGQPNPDGLELRIDGELVEMKEPELLLPSGGRILTTQVPGGLQIETQGGTVVVLTPGFWNHQQIWWLNIQMRQTRGTQGLMGPLPPGSWLPPLPDGSSVGAKPADLHSRYDILYNLFGKSWLVDEDTSLFDYGPGVSPDTFHIPEWPLGESPSECKPELDWEPPADEPQPPIDWEVAAEICKNLFDEHRREHCIQDVAATGEANFAEVYLLTEMIEENKLPNAPELVFPPANEVGLPPATDLVWYGASDQDGDLVDYKVCFWKENEEFAFYHCKHLSGEEYAAEGDEEPQFQFAVPKLESGQVYFWKVIAEDGKGGSAESETRRFEVE